jgi:hypothetical protein
MERLRRRFRDWRYSRWETRYVKHYLHGTDMSSRRD